jgi:hypothetical protein
LEEAERVFGLFDEWALVVRTRGLVPVGWVEEAGEPPQRVQFGLSSETGFPKPKNSDSFTCLFALVIGPSDPSHDGQRPLRVAIEVREDLADARDTNAAPQGEHRYTGFQFTKRCWVRPFNTRHYSRVGESFSMETGSGQSTALPLYAFEFLSADAARSRLAEESTLPAPAAP